MKVLFTTLVMLYLVVDFGDPNLPGAVTFDADDCVEMVQTPRAPSAAQPLPAIMPVPNFRIASPRASAHRILLPRAQRFARAAGHARRSWPPDLSSEEG